MEPQQTLGERIRESKNQVADDDDYSDGDEDKNERIFPNCEPLSGEGIGTSSGYKLRVQAQGTNSKTNTSPAPSPESTSAPAPNSAPNSNPNQECDFFDSFPALKAIFKTHVSTPFKDPDDDEKDLITQEIVERLIQIIAPEFIHYFVTAYSKEYPAIFGHQMPQVEPQIESALSTYESNLSDTERIIYATMPPPGQSAFRITKALALHESEKYPPPLFFLSVSTLEQRLGISDKRAERTLKRLLYSGAMRIEQKGSQWTPGEAPRSTVYRWMPPQEAPPAPPAQEAPPPAPPAPPPPKAKAPSTEHPGFDEFWQAYPRKEGEVEARRQWNTVKPSPERVLKALRRQRREWREKDPRYTPMAKSYLEQMRFNDEPMKPSQRYDSCLGDDNFDPMKCL